jgi:hypothetical protein
MLDDDHSAVGEKFAAPKHRHDRLHLARRVGRVHEDPTKNPALCLTSEALQGAAHARSNGTSPSGEPKLAQIPMEDPQRSRITLHEISRHCAAGEGLDPKRASPGK